jgi:hypothetical protein
MESKIVKAIMEGKKVINIKMRMITLPKPQTSGTDWQKEVYARMEARKIMIKEKL